MLKFEQVIENHCYGKSKATKQVYSRICRKFHAFCLEHKLKWHEFKYHNALEFLEYLRLQEGQKSPSSDRYCNKTIRRCLVLISALYKANRLDFSVFEPAIRLVPVSNKPQKRVTGLIPFENVKQLFDNCGDTLVGKRNKAYLALCFGGALRSSEATSLRLGDIKITNSGTLYVNLANTKTNVNAQQVIAESLVDYLKDYQIQRLKDGAKDSDYFLTSYDYEGKVPTNKPLSRRRMLEVFHKLCFEVLGKTYGTHSMRATAITKLITDGIPHRQIQNFSRHSTIAMVELYDKSVNDIEKSPAKKLNF